MHPQLLDIAGAAALLRMTPQRLRYALEDGDVPGTKVGREWRMWGPAVVAKILGEEAVADLASAPADFLEPVVVDSHELAELLGFTAQTVSKLLRDGALPGQKIGVAWRSYWPVIRQRIATGQPLGVPQP